MVDGWVSVAEAARTLGVSKPRVHQLLKQRALVGSPAGSQVLVDAESVRRRLERRPGAGRPLAPAMAWAVIAALTAAADGGSGIEAGASGNRMVRHRLRRLFAEPHTGPEWTALLRSRAEGQRYWAHPSVRSELLGDPRASVGVTTLPAVGEADQVASATGGDIVVYVANESAGHFLHDYQLEPARDGGVVVRVVAAEPGAAAPRGGEPVPLAASALDLLESDDARVRRSAEAWLEAATAQLSAVPS